MHAKVLGHSSAAITQSIHPHATMERTKDAASEIEVAIFE